MKTVLGSSAKPYYSSIDVVPYFETLYAQQFHGLPTPGLSSALFSQLQALVSEYRVL